MSRLLIVESFDARIAELLTLRFDRDALIEHRVEPEIPLSLTDVIDRPVGSGKRHQRAAQPEVINPILSRQQRRLYARRNRNGVDSRQSVVSR